MIKFCQKNLDERYYKIINTEFNKFASKNNIISKLFKTWHERYLKMIKEHPELTDKAEESDKSQEKDKNEDDSYQI